MSGAPGPELGVCPPRDPTLGSGVEPNIISYRLDAADRLIAVGGSWEKFAQENEGAGAMPVRVLGRSLWDFVTDPSLQELYRRLMKDVRAGRSVRFRCRCDAPAERRVFAIEIKLAAPQPGEVEYITELVAVQPRPSVSWLEGHQSRGPNLVPICSWCSRVRLPDGLWVAIEQAMEKYEDLLGDRVPGLTHGICEDCLSEMNGSLNRESGGGQPLNELSK